MTPGKIIIVSLLLLLPLMWMGCEKKGANADEPVLTYLHVEPQQSADTLTLKLGYHDGDGDLGLAPTQLDPPFDTSSIYFYNLYVEYFEKINGNFQPVLTYHPDSGEVINFNTRFGRLLGEEAKSQAIEGEITYDIELEFPLFSVPVVSDTVKLRVWIYDRRLHKSNTLETGEIILR